MENNKRPKSYLANTEDMKKFQARMPLRLANWLNDTYGQDRDAGVNLSFSRTITEALNELKTLKGV